MTDDLFDEIDFDTTLRHAQETLSDSDYRRRYRAADFVTYNAKQREALNCTASALYVKAANQSGKTQ
jgi:hypothetical protein